MLKLFLLLILLVLGIEPAHAQLLGGVSENALGAGAGLLGGGIGALGGLLGGGLGLLSGLLGGGGGGQGGTGGSAPNIISNPNVRAGGLSNTIVTGPLVGGAGGGGGGGGSGGFFGLFGGGKGGAGGEGGNAIQSIDQHNTTNLAPPNLGANIPQFANVPDVNPMAFNPIMQASPLLGGSFVPPPSTPYAQMFSQAPQSSAASNALSALGAMGQPSQGIAGMNGQQGQSGAEAFGGGSSAPPPTSAMGLLHGALEQSAYALGKSPTGSPASPSGLVPPPPPEVPSMLSSNAPAFYAPPAGSPGAPKVAPGRPALAAALSQPQAVSSPLVEGLQKKASQVLEGSVESAREMYMIPAQNQMRKASQLEGHLDQLLNAQEQELYGGGQQGLSPDRLQTISAQAVASAGPMPQTPPLTWRNQMYFQAHPNGYPAYEASQRARQAAWNTNYRSIFNNLVSQEGSQQRAEMRNPAEVRRTIKEAIASHLRQAKMYLGEYDRAVKQAETDAFHSVNQGLRAAGVDIQSSRLDFQMAHTNAMDNLHLQAEAYREDAGTQRIAIANRLANVAEERESRIEEDEPLNRAKTKAQTAFFNAQAGGVDLESAVSNYKKKYPNMTPSQEATLRQTLKDAGAE